MADSINVNFGSMLLGVLITAVGYGITLMQTGMYFTRFPNDPKLVRATVWSLLILDTSHVALSWHMIYHYLVLNFNNPPALDESIWSFDLTVVITAVITLIAHCFYARRVFILGGQKWVLTVIILSLSIVRTVFGCIVTVDIFKLRSFAVLPNHISPLVGTGLGAGTLADFIITFSLVYFLRSHHTGFSRTDNLLDKLTYWAVNNGFLTSIVGLVVIITFITLPRRLLFLALHLLLSKLYANSLLATLNFRHAHRGRGKVEDATSFQMPSMRRSQSGKDGIPGPVVHVVTTRRIDSDIDPPMEKKDGVRSRLSIESDRV